MGRFVHLMATSLLVLVMISSNSPPSQAVALALILHCISCAAILASSLRIGTTAQLRSALLFVVRENITRIVPTAQSHTLIVNGCAAAHDLWNQSICNRVIVSASMMHDG
nr:unnamed protein product [Digitaria exilis]